MKDLMALVAICKADLDILGIKYGSVRNWTVNTRAKCRLGQCRKIAGDLFDIKVMFSLYLQEHSMNSITCLPNLRKNLIRHLDSKDSFKCSS